MTETLLLALGQALVGLVLLFLGAKWLVTGSSNFARSLGISPLVIGLTIVGFGTSAPELLVSIMAATQGKSAIALGNIVGSNIANIALILGAAATLHPLKCQPGLLYREIPIMLAVTGALIVFTLDGQLNFVEGIIFALGLVGFLWYSYAAESHDPELAEAASPDAPEVSSHVKQILYIVAGIVVLTLGADWLLTGSVEVAMFFGTSEKFIGLTLVAVGTSLPELATSIFAAIRREAAISIGNVIGSNIFNILGILGITAIITPITIAGGLINSGFLTDYLVMLAFALLTVVLMKAGRVITRWEGIGLLSCYSAYVIFLLLGD